MRVRRFWPCAVIFACATGCAAGSAGTPAASVPAADSAIGARLPQVKLKDFEGRSVDPAALKGKVVLLDIWASWCAPCKEELPLLDAMAGRLKEKGVRILAVSIDENRDDAVAFLQAHAAAWTLGLAHDPDGKIAERLKPPKMPTSYIVDRAGIIREVNAGFERADVARIEGRLLALAGS